MYMCVGLLGTVLRFLLVTESRKSFNMQKKATDGKNFNHNIKQIVNTQILKTFNMLNMCKF